MTDIVDRIRSLHYVHVPVASQLFEEAACEIERLRLTDAEREAVAWCRDNLTAMAHTASAFAYIHAATLRGLLERLK